MRTSAELLGEPVGGQRPVLVRDVVADVVALLEQHPRRVGRSLRDPLRLLPRDQAVELAGDHEQRLVDARRAVGQVELCGLLARLLEARRAGVMHDRLARRLRHRVPALAEVERAAYSRDGADPLLVRRRARGVVAAERYACDPDRAEAVELVEDGADRA